MITSFLEIAYMRVGEAGFNLHSLLANLDKIEIKTQSTIVCALIGLIAGSVFDYARNKEFSNNNPGETQRNPNAAKFLMTLAGAALGMVEDNY